MDKLKLEADTVTDLAVAAMRGTIGDIRLATMYMYEFMNSAMSSERLY